MANTGRKIVTSLKEISLRTQSPTGLTKANVLGDPDYVAPYSDPAACAVNYTTTCPSNIFTNVSGLSVDYEFALVGTTINNPNIRKVAVELRNSSEVTVDRNEFTLPRANYFGGTLHAAGSGTYNIRVLFLDANGVQMSGLCNGVSVSI